MNTNPAAEFDTWFLNLFPRSEPFRFNPGGYATLNFIPSLATMIFGLLAGGLLRSRRPGLEKVRLLVTFGVAGLLLGGVLHLAGVCPIVKRIWTPSWTVFSGGWVVLMLAAFYYVIDLRGHRRWTFPLLVVGMNSLAMYVLVHVAEGYLERSLITHFGRGAFEAFGAPFAPILIGTATLAILWLILWWMYRNRVFVRL